MVEHREECTGTVALLRRDPPEYVAFEWPYRADVAERELRPGLVTVSVG